MSRCRGDLGQAGGAEMLVFGLLVFVGGTIVVATAWAAVDIKLALGAATRDAARAYVEAGDSAAATSAADAAARAAIAGHGREPARLVDLTIDTDGGFGRCARVTVRAGYPLPHATVPWIGGVGGATVIHASHSELVDPYRSGLAGPSRCAA